MHEVDRQIAEVRKTFTGSMREVLTRISFFKEWFGDWGTPPPGALLEGGAPSPSVPTPAPRGFRADGNNITPEGKNVKSVSVVTDAKGAPLLVHHGTTAMPRFVDFQRGDIGSHFGTREQAENRVREESWDNEHEIMEGSEAPYSWKEQMKLFGML